MYCHQCHFHANIICSDYPLAKSKNNSMAVIHFPTKVNVNHTLTGNFIGFMCVDMYSTIILGSFIAKVANFQAEINNFSGRCANECGNRNRFVVLGSTMTMHCYFSGFFFFSTTAHSHFYEAHQLKRLLQSICSIN